jgi:hypothetical protein
MTVIPLYLFKETTPGNLYLYAVNRMVQPVRIRQVRVVREPRDSCKVPVPVRLGRFVLSCYPAADEGTVDKTPIVDWPPGSQIQYQTAEQLRTARSWLGELPYDGGGFVHDFELNVTQADVLQRLQFWKTNKWVDLHTRAVFLNFVVYNADNRFFLSVTLLFEFLPSGKVRPSHSFRVFRMGLATPADLSALVLDSLAYFGAFVLAAYDVRKAWKLGLRNYCHDLWHALNWLMYAVFVITVLFKFQFFLVSFRCGSLGPLAALHTIKRGP